jgi:hypothetical protein
VQRVQSGRELARLGDVGEDDIAGIAEEDFVQTEPFSERTSNMKFHQDPAPMLQRKVRIAFITHLMQNCRR